MDFLKSVSGISLCRLNQYLVLNEKFFLSDIAETFENTDVSEFAEYVNDNEDTFSESKRRYCSIINHFKRKYKKIAEDIIDFAIMPFYIPDLYSIFAEHDFKTDINLILKLNNIKSLGYAELMDFVRQLRQFFNVSDNITPLTNIKISADNRIIGFLDGDDVQDSIIKDICSIFNKNMDIHELILNREIAEKISFILKNKKSVVHITGDKYTGKKFLIKHSAAKIQKEILFVDFRLLMRYDAESITEALWNLKREALFYNRILCWYNVDFKALSMKKWEITEFVRLCIDNFIENNIQVCICSDSHIDFSDYCRYCIDMFKIKNADESDRIALWKGFCEIYNYHNIEYYNFAMRYKLSAGQISQVFRKKSERFFGSELSENQIFDIICSETGYSEEGILKLKTSDYTFDDLKLPEFQKNILRQVCINFKNSYLVYNEWNMKKKFPYGRGMSVLLTGPPGTGKTMTACVIANTLGLPLYQADMSQIVDKYIGETEKNIDALFAEAEKRNCILFLDEADSLCGKRSEISDSKDKYANNDTAFILQRIEKYDGIVILATNYISNIDNAFMRRMKYVVQFSVPDKKIRYEIWKSSFTDEVAVSSDVDFEYLAEQFEFSGSNIKNIALASVFLSASENTPVNMKHILTNVYNEYQKQQRHMFAVEFGRYENLYDEIVN